MQLTDTEIQQCTQTLNNALAWLDEHRTIIDRDDDLMTHYKGVYLHAVRGDRAKARRYADLMAGRYLQDDGDFRTRADWKGWARLPCAPANRYIYSNGWIVTGLQRMGAYAAARKGLDFILRFQSPVSGGCYSRFDEKTGEIKTNEINTGSTSAAGLAMIACGYIPEAIRAGDFLLQLIEKQPDPDNFFYVTYSDEQGVLTDVFGSETVSDMAARQHFCVNARNDPRGELMWQLGKPMKLLATLYGVTGEQRFLTGALWLLDFFDNMAEERWQNLGCCKIMWGSAELFLHTGDPRCFETAKRFLLWLCEIQEDWGGWIDKLWVKDPSAIPPEGHSDVVQELSSEISDVIYCLSGDTVCI